MVGLSFLGNPTRLSFDACCEELLLFPEFCGLCFAIGPRSFVISRMVLTPSSSQKLAILGLFACCCNDFPNPLSRFGLPFGGIYCI